MEKKRWFASTFTKRLVVSILILIQLGFLFFVIVSGGNASKIIDAFLRTVSFFVAFAILRSSGKNEYKITWIFLILIFPVFGGMFYLLIKTQSLKKKVNLRIQNIENRTMSCYNMTGDYYDKASESCPENIHLIKYLQGKLGFPVYGRTSTKYLSPGEQMFRYLKRELQKAEEYIFLEYFIIEEGVMWDSILDILEEKAKSGVDVRVMYDDMGCILKLPKEYPQQLKKRGIKCVVFNPFKPVLEAMQNNRDHRKITVIDGKVAFTGGINLADEYINEIEKFGHWKDSSVMVTGDGAWGLTVMFLQMWSFASGKDEDFTVFYPKNRETVYGDGFVQPYSDSPIDNENVGEHVYLHIINSARKYLYINTPYLVIDDTMLTALKLAAKSGVDVKIITPGMWDKKIVRFTSRSYYRELIDAGVQIYEYQRGFMHSKIFVSDDILATVGTTNLDYRSLYLHFECGICMYRTNAVEQIKYDFLKTLERCKKVKSEDFREKNIFSGLLDWIFRLFAPLL